MIFAETLTKRLKKTNNLDSHEKLTTNEDVPSPPNEEDSKIHRAKKFLFVHWQI